MTGINKAQKRGNIFWFLLPFILVFILYFYMSWGTGRVSLMLPVCVIFIFVFVYSLSYPRIRRLKRFNLILKEFSNKHNLDYTPHCDSTLEWDGFSSVLKGGYGILQIQIKGRSVAISDEGYLIKSLNVFTHTIFVKYYPKKERIVNPHLKCILPNPLKLIEPEIERPKKLIKTIGEYVVYCDNPEFFSEFINLISLDELTKSKATIHAGPKGFIYYKGDLPQNFTELNNDIEEVKTLLSRLKGIETA